MRGALFVALAAAGAAVYACDSFEESNPAADAGEEATLPDASEASSATDAGTDQNVACGEPDWVTTASAEFMAACGGSQVNLRTNAAHCGRCDHFCGAEQCVDGNCAERKDDTGAVVLYDVRDGVLYYARRPGGSLGFEAHEIKRFISGAPQLLGSLEVDGSTEKSLTGASAFGDFVYVRTNTSLRRASLVIPSGALPELVATLGAADGLSSVQAAADRVYVSVPNPGRVDQVYLDGGVEPFIASAPYVGETRLSGTRYFYFSQRFVYFPFNESASALRVRDGATDDPLYASDDRVGGLGPMDPNEKELYVMRAGATGGAIVRIDLETKATEPFYEGALDNSLFHMSVGFDATHVYWVKGSGDATEVWKKARCGGAAVRIAKHKSVYRALPVGDRVFMGTEDGLYSIAK